GYGGCCTGGRVMVPGRVVQHRVTTNGRVGEPVRVAIERTKTVGRIEAGCVVKKRERTSSRSFRAGGKTMERHKTNRRVVEADCCIEAEERLITLSGVLVGIASVRCWVNRSSRRGKRQPCEGEGDEKKPLEQRRPANRISFG